MDGDLQLNETEQAAQTPAHLHRALVVPEYLTSLEVQQVVPQPETWTADGAGTVLTFPVSRPTMGWSSSCRSAPTRSGSCTGRSGFRGRSR